VQRFVSYFAYRDKKKARTKTLLSVGTADSNNFVLDWRRPGTRKMHGQGDVMLKLTTSLPNLSLLFFRPVITYIPTTELQSIIFFFGQYKLYMTITLRLCNKNTSSPIGPILLSNRKRRLFYFFLRAQTTRPLRWRRGYSSVSNQRKY